ncbi:MAG: hypothetical protein MUE32_07330 [Bacteroidales bacterium]|jgi:hypothetical protein|nr:hypothetical protein [Bacteroidales bacterium]
MDHIVYVNSKARELENLIEGKKSMIIRGAQGRKLPHGRVSRGDMLYFLNNNGEAMIRAKGIVSSVYCSDKLSVEESFETIIRHQDKLQLPDEQFDMIAGKRFLVLVGVVDIEPVEPIFFDRSRFANIDDWIPVGDIAVLTVAAS